MFISLFTKTLLCSNLVYYIVEPNFRLKFEVFDKQMNIYLSFPR